MSKKNGGRRPMINLKSLNNFLPFQKGGPTLTKGLVAIEWLHKQNRLEEFLILHSNFQKLPEIYTCSMGKGPARFSMSLFWARSSHPYFYRTIENPNSSPTDTQNSSYSLFGQHAFDESYGWRNFKGPKYINLSVGASRIFNKHKKSILQPFQELEFLGLQINSFKDIFIVCNLWKWTNKSYLSAPH